MHIQFIAAFILYLSTVLLIGIAASKNNKQKQAEGLTLSDSSDFILGGRSSHWLMTALSAHASDMSDWLFMGLPAAVYLNGSSSMWIPIGLLAGMFLSWQYIASPLRIATEKYKAFTLASYFKQRFNDQSGSIVAIAALISFFFFAVYLSVGLKGIGYVLRSAFDIPYHLGICLAVLIVLTYIVLGGFVAVAWIDLFQGTFLLLALMFVPLYAFFHGVSIPVILKAAAQKNIPLSLLPDHSLRGIISILLNPFAWCLGYFGMPHILAKFMGASNPQEMHKSKYIGIIWQFLATSSAVAVGLVGIAYFQNGIPGKPEFIFIEMAKELFSPWLAGFILCAILAATISTVDSQLLVLAGTMAEDFYKNLLRTRATTRQVFRVYQLSLVASALAGLCIAWNEESTIMSLVKYAWSGLGATFGPLVILSLYSNRVNKYGALAGILVGALVSSTWDLVNPLLTTISIYSIAPAFLCSLFAIIIVSDLTHKWQNPTSL